MIRKRLAICALALGVPAASHAQVCAPVGAEPLAGFTALDPLLYLDLPDPDFIRVTQSIEAQLFAPVIGQEGWGPAKRYCQVGIARMVVDFDVPTLDDAQAATVTRAVYTWNSSADPVGWQLDALGERPRCARGDDPWALLCP